MAHPGVAEGERSGWLAPLLFVPVLLAVVVASSATDPDWVSSVRVTALYLVLVAGLVHLVATRRDDASAWWWLAHLLATGALLLVMLAYETGNGPADPSRGLKLLAVYLLFVGYLLLHVLAPGAALDRRRFDDDPFLGLALLAVAVVIGVHFVHALGAPPGSGRSLFGVGIGLVFGMNVLVVGQYVSRREFFRLVATLSAVLVALGLLVYVVGPYRVLGLEVQLFGDTFTPLLGGSFHHVQSVFVNPNTLGKWAFAGTVTAVVELHRDVERRSLGLSSLVLGVLVAVNVAGLYFTNSRASMLASAAALVLYGSSVLVGGRALVATLVAIGASIAAFLAGIGLGLLDVDPHGRFVIWLASLRAIATDPSLFGAGIVRTSEVIAPYLTEYRGLNTHNSYLTMFIRIGLLGGLAYLVLTVGSVLHRAASAERVNPGVLALAFGFAVDLLFVSYTLFHYNAVPVLAALAFGYLVTDGLRPARPPTSSPLSTLGSDRRDGVSEQL